MHWLINECVVCCCCCCLSHSLYSFTSCENFKYFSDICVAQNYRKEIPSAILSPYVRILWNLKVKRMAMYESTESERLMVWKYFRLFWGLRRHNKAHASGTFAYFIITFIVRAHTAFLALDLDCFTFEMHFKRIIVDFSAVRELKINVWGGNK